MKSKSKIPPLNKPDGTKAFDAKDKIETLESLRLLKFVYYQSANKVINHNSGKFPGPDGWHPCLLKEISDLIDTPLSMLFQKSLNEGVLPLQWLEACITAIYKKGLKDIRRKL